MLNFTQVIQPETQLIIRNQKIEFSAKNSIFDFLTENLKIGNKPTQVAINIKNLS